VAGEPLLVRLPNWLGDVLMARPMLHALRAMAGPREVVAVGPAPLLALLASEKLWDRAVDRTAPHWPRAGVAVLAPPSFSSAWRAWTSRASRRIGYRGEGRDLLLTDALPRPGRGAMHLSREYLALAERAGAREVPLPVLAAPTVLSDRPSERTAVLAPGAVYGPAKRWPEERFVALGRALAARGLAVQVCGGAGDVAVCERVAATLPGARMLAGTTGLADQAALCAAAAVVVSNDSGMAHLAAAVGAPTVALFGSTSSTWTAPLGRRVRVVQHAPVCAPCFQRTCAIGLVCLTRIEVRAVLEAAEAVMALAPEAA